jgi:hypothetical protein
MYLMPLKAVFTINILYFFHEHNPRIKQLIETNAIVSYDEMNRFYYDFKAISSASLCYVITADQSHSLIFLVGWFFFLHSVFIFLIIKGK